MTVPAPPARPPRSPWWRHYWGKFVSAVLFLAAVAAIASFLVTDLGFKPPWVVPAPVGSPVSQEARPTGIAESNAKSSTSTAEEKAGACLDDAGNITSCDRKHSSEVVTTIGSCNLPALVDYAGGALMRDVIRDDLVPVASPHGCIVAIPDGLSTKIQDGLLGKDHAALRQCWDRFTEQDVSCDQAHTAEVVYFNPDPGATETSCVPQADAYTNGAFARHQDQLEALVRTSGQSISCLVQARGSNELSGSLRNLGTGALPLEARP